DIIVISDEVYEHIVLDRGLHESIAKYEYLSNRTFIYGSFGKTYHITGWKIGYCVGPTELMREFRKTHQFNVFSVDHAVQKALATYLREPQHYLQLNQFYQNKRDLFLSGISNSRFKSKACQGTYFQLLDYNAISKAKDEDFAELLVREHRI